MGKRLLLAWIGSLLLTGCPGATLSAKGEAGTPPATCSPATPGICPDRTPAACPSATPSPSPTAAADNPLKYALFIFSNDTDWISPVGYDSRALACAGVVNATGSWRPIRDSSFTAKPLDKGVGYAAWVPGYETLSHFDSCGARMLGMVRVEADDGSPWFLNVATSLRTVSGEPVVPEANRMSDLFPQGAWIDFSSALPDVAGWLLAVVSTGADTPKGSHPLHFVITLRVAGQQKDVPLDSFTVTIP